jgi:hypothetical protein
MMPRGRPASHARPRICDPRNLHDAADNSSAHAQPPIPPSDTELLHLHHSRHIRAISAPSPRHLRFIRSIRGHMRRRAGE